MKKIKKNQTNDTTIKGIQNLFRLQKENKAIKDRITRDIRNVFEDEEKYYFKPVIIGNFWNNNYIKYKSNDDRKTLSVKNVLIKLDHTYKI